MTHTHIYIYIYIREGGRERERERERGGGREREGEREILLRSGRVRRCRWQFLSPARGSSTQRDGRRRRKKRAALRESRWLFAFSYFATQHLMAWRTRRWRACTLHLTYVPVNPIRSNSSSSPSFSSSLHIVTCFSLELYIYIYCTNQHLSTHLLSRHGLRRCFAWVPIQPKKKGGREGNWKNPMRERERFERECVYGACVLVPTAGPSGCALGSLHLYKLSLLGGCGTNVDSGRQRHAHGPKYAEYYPDWTKEWKGLIVARGKKPVKNSQGSQQEYQPAKTAKPARLRLSDGCCQHLGTNKYVRSVLWRRWVRACTQATPYTCLYK